jgi:hypothetical protein
VVHHVAAGEHARDAGLGRAGLDQQVAVRVHRQLALEQLGRGRVADRDERALAGELADSPVWVSASLRPVSPPASGSPRNSSTRLFQITVIFGMREQPVLEDLLGAQLAAAVDQGDVVGVVGQVQRFLDRGVAAADHRDLLAAVEEPVAGGAGRDALAAEPLLAGHAEPLGLRAGGDDEHVADVLVAAVADRAERRAALAMSTSTIVSHIVRVPTCSACACISCISHGPWITSRKPG